jgi:hypothetical protein
VVAEAGDHRIEGRERVDHEDTVGRFGREQHPVAGGDAAGVPGGGGQVHPTLAANGQLTLGDLNASTSDVAGVLPIGVEGRTQTISPRDTILAAEIFWTDSGTLGWTTASPPA